MGAGPLGNVREIQRQEVGPVLDRLAPSFPKLSTEPDASPVFLFCWRTFFFELPYLVWFSFVSCLFPAPTSYPQHHPHPQPFSSLRITAAHPSLIPISRQVVLDFHPSIALLVVYFSLFPFSVSVSFPTAFPSDQCPRLDRTWAIQANISLELRRTSSVNAFS